MSQSLDTRLKSLLANHQARLVDLLMVDLDLAFTFLETAGITGIPERQEKLVQRARSVLIFVRQFLPRIEDPKMYAELDERCRRLEDAIQTGGAA